MPPREAGHYVAPRYPGIAVARALMAGDLHAAERLAAGRVDWTLAEQRAITGACREAGLHGNEVDPVDLMHPVLSRTAAKTAERELDELLEYASRDTLDVDRAERSLRRIVEIYLEDASTFGLTPGRPEPEALRLLAGVAADLATYDAQGRPAFADALATFGRIVLIGAQDADAA